MCDGWHVAGCAAVSPLSRHVCTVAAMYFYFCTCHARQNIDLWFYCTCMVRVCVRMRARLWLLECTLNGQKQRYTKYNNFVVGKTIHVHYVWHIMLQSIPFLLAANKIDVHGLSMHIFANWQFSLPWGLKCMCSLWQCRCSDSLSLVSSRCRMLFSLHANSRLSSQDTHTRARIEVRTPLISYR